MQRYGRPHRMVSSEEYSLQWDCCIGRPFSSLKIGVEGKIEWFLSDVCLPGRHFHSSVQVIDCGYMEARITQIVESVGCNPKSINFPKPYYYDILRNPRTKQTSNRWKYSLFQSLPPKGNDIKLDFPSIFSDPVVKGFLP